MYYMYFIICNINTKIHSF